MVSRKFMIEIIVSMYFKDNRRHKRPHSGESYIAHEVALKIEELLDKYSNSNVEVLIIHYYEKVA